MNTITGPSSQVTPGSPQTAVKCQYYTKTIGLFDGMTMTLSNLHPGRKDIGISLGCLTTSFIVYTSLTAPALVICVVLLCLSAPLCHARKIQAKGTSTLSRTALKQVC